jgi:hypothetical protein
MKLTFQQDDDLQPKPDARSDRRSGFSRARAQLSQAVGGVLVNSLGALSGRRAQSALPAAAPASSTHGMRLREVIERDRALVASLPPPAPSERAAPAAEQDDWMELRAAQDLAEQETSAIRARTDEPRADTLGSHDPERASTLETFAEESLEPDEWFAEEARAIEVLAPRGDAIAQAIADAIALDVEDDDDQADDDQADDEDDDDDEDTREMVPVQLEPLVASTASAGSATSATPAVVASSTAATVVMPKPMQVALCKEPIRTRTMAKLLATQGHRERALSIYDHLIQKGLGDESLRAEADALRATAD